MSVKGIWTEKTCRDEASKYDSRSTFKAGNCSAYNFANRGGFLLDIFPISNVAKIKWNYETCKAEALKYSSVQEFRAKNKPAYDKASLNGWLKEITEGLATAHKWNSLEAVATEALKYQTRTEFINKSGRAYQYAAEIGFLEQICGHMPVASIEWTKELINQEASKFASRADFSRQSPNAYSAAHRHGVLNEVCQHMGKANMEYIPRLVYVYEFEDNHAYVGLTWNMEARDAYRKTSEKDSVTTHIRLTGLQPKIKVLTELMPALNAQKLEQEWLDIYRANGWIMLNKARAGSLGGYSNKNKPNKRKQNRMEILYI